LGVTPSAGGTSYPDPGKLWTPFGKRPISVRRFIKTNNDHEVRIREELLNER